MRAIRWPPSPRAAGHSIRPARLRYLAQGLIPEAEQEFHSALTADPNNAAAHAGLAQVRERSGTADDARAEAQTSLKLAPNVDAYLVLARLDLKADNSPPPPPTSPPPSSNPPTPPPSASNKPSNPAANPSLENSTPQPRR